MMAVILDDAALKIIRQALRVGERYGLNQSKKALKLLDTGTDLVSQINERMDNLCQNDSDRYLHQDELNILQMHRTEIERGLDSANAWANLRDHIEEGKWDIQYQREMNDRLEKGEKHFMLPRDRKPMKGDDEENE